MSKSNALLVSAVAIFIGSVAAAITKPEISFLRDFSLVDGNVYTRTPELKKWVEEQNDRTRKYLDAEPLAAKIKARDIELAPTNPPARFNTPSGDFFVKAGSLAIQVGGKESILVDKAKLNGSVVTDFKVSPDSTLVAYAVAKGGSDSVYWSTYSVKLGTDVGDTPTRIRIYTLNWASDSKGFYYPKWPELADEANMVANRVERTGGVDVGYHKVGTPAADDVVVFKNPYRSTVYAINDVPGTDLLVAHRTKLGFTHKLNVLLGSKQADGSYGWKNIVNSADHLGRVAAVTKDRIYVVTSELGNNYGLLAYSVDKPSEKKVIVDAQAGLVLSQVQRVGDVLIAQYYNADLQNSLRVFDLDGNLLDSPDYAALGLPLRGSVPALLVGGEQSNRAEFSYSAIETPAVTLSYDVSAKKFTALTNTRTVAFDGWRVDSDLLLIKSFDGQKIPVQYYKRSDQLAPEFVYIYYYGSNGVVNASTFNKKFQLMLELGGAVALVGTRGGGELGAKWYRQGMQDRLGSVKDVVWAARWLKANRVIVGNRVVASGRSYGGMLTNAVLAHYSADFDIFVPTVPVADLGYYMTDYHGSIGWDDIGFDRDADGQIVDTPEVRRKVLEFSPAHNIRKMTSLGAVISFTADQDERVGPHQTYLMTSILQKRFPQSAVYMFEAKGGHNARAEAVDEATFIAKTFGLKDFLPLKP